MRTKTAFKIIRIYEYDYDCIISNKKNFQKTIGGGTWSIADTVKERNKILTSLKEDLRRSIIEKDNIRGFGKTACIKRDKIKCLNQI